MTASATSAGLKTAIINQRGETLLEGFHLYRVLKHEPPKENT